MATDADELAAVCGEIAKLRAEVAALARVLGLVYEAGRDDALGRSAQLARRSRRRRGAKLRVIPGRQLAPA